MKCNKTIKKSKTCTFRINELRETIEQFFVILELAKDSLLINLKGNFRV